MEQSEALLSLQRMARQTNEEIVRFVRQGDKWAATLQVIAEFPPSDGGDDEGPEPKAPKPAGADSDSDGPDGPPDSDGDSDDGGDGPDGPPGADGPPKPPGAEHGGGGEMHVIEQMLHKVLQGLEQAGIVPKGPDPKMIPGQGPEHVPPPGPPAPPGAGPGGPPPGAGGPPGGDPGNPFAGGAKAAPYGNKLKPGEMPNKPGVVPVGAPSFASVEAALDTIKTAVMGIPNGMMDPLGQDPQSAPQQVPQQSTPGGTCPTCGSPAGASAGGNAGLPGGAPTTSAPPGMPPGPGSAGMQGSQTPSSVSAGTKDTFQLQSSVGMTALEAHTELTAEFSPRGYKVTQLVPQDDGTFVAELTRA
jgi:hypothetical protein